MYDGKLWVVLLGFPRIHWKCIYMTSNLDTTYSRSKQMPAFVRFVQTNRSIFKFNFIRASIARY